MQISSFRPCTHVRWFQIVKIILMIDMTGGKVKIEKTENHEFLGRVSLDLANFDKTLFYTSLRPN